MSTESTGWILLTGGAGFLGGGFIASLNPEERSRCVCLVRKATPALAASVGAVVEGFFGEAAVLEKLAAFNIVSVVHLAAVTGGCKEVDGMAINVEGTRVLLKELSARGCRRFVLASSIAAVGLQRTDFRPLSLPMMETHPCMDKDGYGFSKFLMEEVAAYYHRQNPSLTIYSLRFGVIEPDEEAAVRYVPAQEVPEWSYAHFSRVRRADAVRAIRLALTKPSAGRCMAINIVARQTALSVSVPELFSKWYPEHSLDLTAYQKSGHERDAVFSTELAQREFEFVAEWPS